MGEHALPDIIVSVRVKEAALCIQPVPSGPAAFLLVVFKRFGHSRVNDISHIGFIYSHSKSHGGYDCLHLFLDKCLLVILPVKVRHPGMIRQGAISKFIQGSTDAVHILTTDTINYPGISRMAVHYPADLIQDV